MLGLLCIMLLQDVLHLHKFHKIGINNFHFFWLFFFFFLFQKTFVPIKATTVDATKISFCSNNTDKLSFFQLVKKPH